MRDIVLIVFLFGSLPFILRRPTYGVMLWVWISVMNPHRLSWGIAYDMPFAQAIAIATLAGMVFSREPKRVPVTGVTVTLFLLWAWMGFSTFFAFDIDNSLKMLERVSKTMLMTFVAIYLLHTRKHIHTLICILAGSVAYYAIKGGIFTVASGGAFTVWGPEGSYIEENNSLALATVMTIPLLQYIRIQAKNLWLRRGLGIGMILCGFSALGSHSRGALLAIGAMLFLFWTKSRQKLGTGFVIILLLPIAIAFMPQKWHDRMSTIGTYEADESAMGRIQAWEMAYNLAKDRILIGGGFEIYNSAIFARYAGGAQARAAHSIYFQTLGEHGFIGLFLFLLFWAMVWRNASWIVRQTKGRDDLLWASDLARMIQVSLLGYAAGGAFLSLAYYDVPYYLAAAIVVTRALVERELAQNLQPAPQPGLKDSSGPPTHGARKSLANSIGKA